MWRSIIILQKPTCTWKQPAKCYESNECLEQQINTLLFVRTNRGVELTPEGEKLYIRVSAAMAQIFEAEEELSDSMSLSHGSISIGAVRRLLIYFFLIN